MQKAKLLVIDDEVNITQLLKQFFEKKGHEVLTAGSGEEGVEVFKKEIADVIFLDLNLPGMSGLETLESLRKLSSDVIVIIITAYGHIETAVSAIKAGAYDFVEKPFDLDRISVIVNKALETVHLKRELSYLKEDRVTGCNYDNIIAVSKSMKDVLSLVKKVAESDINTVLIQGESGTGKNLIARCIHYCGSRAAGQFVEVTSTAIPETLLESELFGYEKGAFTGANISKRGLFEIADGGTLYLDEIGDSAPSTQSKLLRVIDEKIFKRVGGLKDISVNVRIIAATNKNLEKAMKDGSFRADLYYRLRVIPITLPPLRERKEDIIPLAMYYIQKYDKEFKKTVRGIAPDAERLLLEYPWYGNIREIRNVIERICLLEKTDMIYPEHIPPEIVDFVDSAPAGQTPVKLSPEGLSLKDVSRDMEKELVAQALHMVGGNQTRAARLLGVSRDILRYKMQKYGFLK